MSRGILVLVY